MWLSVFIRMDPIPCLTLKFYEKDFLFSQIDIISTENDNHLFLTEDVMAPTPVEAFEPPPDQHHVPHPHGF